MLDFVNQVHGRTFMPIEASEQYSKSKNPPVMETRGSKFVKFQECRIQEMADEVRVSRFVSMRAVVVAFV